MSALGITLTLAGILIYIVITIKIIKTPHPDETYMTSGEKEPIE